MTQDHIMLTIVSAVTAFASVQIIKPWIKGFFTDVAKRRSVVRLVSVLSVSYTHLTLPTILLV